MRLWKNGKKFSMAFIKYFSKIIRQMKENVGFFTFRLKFSWYRLIFPTSQSKRASDNITNQNSCDVTAVFPYSHLNTAIDQRECTYYPDYFITENSENQNAKKRSLTWLNVWTSWAKNKNFETNLLAYETKQLDENFQKFFALHEFFRL